VDNSPSFDENPGIAALKRAIQLSQGQKRLADRLDALGRRQTPPLQCKPQNVWAWLKRDGRVPAEWARLVAEAVDFQVLPTHVRPDIYPNTTDGVPPELLLSDAFLSTLQRDGKAA
jgi:DNA-binding transcriptional regulator YdaS (Cro superfamily)